MFPPFSFVCFFLLCHSVLATLTFVKMVVGPTVVEQTPKVVSINGKPGIVFISNGTLYFTRASGNSDSHWSTPVVLDSPDPKIGSLITMFASAALVNGNIAVAYYASYRLKYVRAIDENALSWAPAVTIIPYGRDYYPTLIVSDGFPAVAYQDKGGPILSYIRAQDTSGLHWGPFESIFSEADQVIYGWPVSAAVVNGYPAAVAGYTSGLSYIRALSPSGVDPDPKFPNTFQWGQLIIIDTTPFPLDLILLEVDGAPAVGYIKVVSSSFKVMYVRALDANGDHWPAPVELVFSTTIGYYISFALIRGFPALVFFDTSKEAVQFLIAKDTRGYQWHAPSLAATFPKLPFGAFQSASLADINGRASIALVEGANQALIFLLEPTDGSCTACSPSSSGCLGTATELWCGANCVGDSYVGACSSSICTCPLDAASEPVSQCTRCNPAVSGCFNVATDFWCQANCVNGAYGGACSRSTCSCPK